MIHLFKERRRKANDHALLTFPLMPQTFPQIKAFDTHQAGAWQERELFRGDGRSHLASFLGRLAQRHLAPLLGSNRPSAHGNQ
jgi:hypothetical protein